MTQLGSATVKGMRWTYLASVAGIVLQLPYAAVMARLLTPEDFGLMALAHLVLRFAHHFAQGGLRSAVVQRETVTTRDIRVIFTLALVVGTCSFTAVWYVAPYATELVRGPAELTHVIRATALMLVFMALGAPAAGLLARAMRYRAVAVTDFASFAVGYCAVGFVSALSGAGVWSLVYGTLCWYFLQALLPCLLVRHSMRPLLDVPAMRNILGFGGKVSVNGFLEYLTEDFGKLAIGRYVGIPAAGLYDRAALLASLPLYQIQAAAAKVLLPAFSRIRHDTGRLGASYTDCVCLTTLGLLPLWAVIAASSEQLVALLLGGQWHGSADLVPLLGLVSVLALVAQFLGTLAEAMGVVGPKVVIHLLQLAVLVAGTALALTAGGRIHALMTVVLIGQAVRLALFQAWMSRLFPQTRRPVALAYTQAALVAALIWTVLWCVQHLLGGSCPTAVLLAVKLLAAAALMACLLRYGGSLRGVRVAQERGLLPSALTGRRPAPAQ
jgi:O-antigen/teichoic acid export membrane protein